MLERKERSLLALLWCLWRSARLPPWQDEQQEHKNLKFTAAHVFEVNLSPQHVLFSQAWRSLFQVNLANMHMCSILAVLRIGQRTRYWEMSSFSCINWTTKTAAKCWTTVFQVFCCYTYEITSLYICQPSKHAILWSCLKGYIIKSTSNHASTLHDAIEQHVYIYTCSQGYQIGTVGNLFSELIHRVQQLSVASSVCRLSHGDLCFKYCYTSPYRHHNLCTVDVIDAQVGE